MRVYKGKGTEGDCVSKQAFQTALDFTINDYTGQPVTLSDYLNRKHIVLVFNRGFF